MHTAPPRPLSTLPPTLSCTQKRGPTVATRSSTIRPAHRNFISTSRAQPRLGQSGFTDTVSAMDDRSRHGQRSGLWDPSQAIRFAPPVLGEIQRPRCISSQVEVTPRVDFATAAPPHNPTSGVHKAPAPLGQGHGEGVGVGGQPSVGSDIPTGDDHSVNASVESEVSMDQGLSASHKQKAETEVAEQDTKEHSPLTFHIPEEKLRAAMLAAPETRGSYWSAKLYEGPNGESLSTHYCKSMEVAERVAKYFLKEKVVGFDIEWKPRGNPYSIKQNASLIQLACENRIALFHISLFPGTKPEQLMPPSLKQVLESPDVLKVGVAVKGDFTRLQKYLGVQAQGVFELSRLHNLVEWYEEDPSKVTNKLVKLATQVHQHLQLPLYKGEQLVDEPNTTTSVRESDWSLPLDVQQVHYAAADAYAGFRLYHRLEWKRTQLKPTPPAVRVCDYDNKPAPRPKEPRKRVKAATKPKEDAATELKPEVDPAEEDAEDVDAEGYETAPEELVDSHQLEDSSVATSSKVVETTEDQAVDACPATEPASESDQSAQLATVASPKRKRVGRINWSRLKGPEPGYPILPPTSQEPVEKSPPAQPFDSPSDRPSEASHNDDLVQSQSSEASNVSKDEFADPELEEAFAEMDLDGSGEIKEESKEPDLEPVVQDIQAAPTNSPDGLLETSETSSTTDEDTLATAEERRNLQTVNPPDLEPAVQDIQAASANSSAGPVEDVLEELHSQDGLPQTVETSSTADGVLEPQKSEEQTYSVAMAPSSAPPSAEASHTPEYNSATSWAREYLQSTIPSTTSTTPSRIRATVPHLRGYHMWYHQKLSLDEIAQQLRDPPLSRTTTVNYILQAVSLEKLEHDEEALRDVLMSLPSGMRKGRWKSLADKVGAAH